MTIRNSDHPRPAAHRSFASFAKVLALTVLVGGGAIATFSATAPAAFAGDAWMAHMHGHSPAQMHAHFDQVLTRAGVDGARRQQVERILESAMQAEHADMRRYHASFGRLKALLAAQRVDAEAVASLRREQDALALNCSRRISDTALQVAQLLTPEQRQVLSADIDRMLADHMGHHPAG